MHAQSRQRRTVVGSLGLIAGLVLLAAGLYLVSALGGLTDNGLVPWAWAAVTVIGVGFVHLQVLGAAAMVSLVLDEETARSAKASVSLEKEPQ
jgi:hypothetical protein